MILVEKLLKIFKHGIKPEDLPIVLADVYQDVIKTRGLSPDEIRSKCEETIYYLIDNTDAGKYDEQIDTVVRAMVPTMVTAFMNVRHSNFSIKKCCCC